MATRTERFDLRALLETSRLLSSSLEVDFVLNSLLLTAMSKLLVSKGLVMLHDPFAGAYRIEVAKGRLPEGLRVGDRVPASLLDGGSGGAIPDAITSAGLSVVLPITYHDRTVGLLALGGKATGEPFSDDERSFLEALVNMSATAVHNASMVEELRQANTELGQRVQQLNTLFDVAQGFTAAPDVDRATRTLALTLMGQFMVRRFAVYLRTDAETAFLERAAQRDAPDVDAEILAELATLKQLVLLDEDAPESLQPLGEMGFSLALPLRMKDVARGMLLLGPKLSGEPYTADDVEFLTALGQLTLTAIENARGIEARVEKERLEDELRLARAIQERLLPQEIPQIEGASVAALNLPSRYVAGDYYDVLRLDDDRLLVVMADVSGKGLPASLLMANLQACIHVLAASLGGNSVDLATATSRVNRVIHRNTSITTFITFFWGTYDRRDGCLTYVNAGHNPPFVRRVDGSIDKLEEGGVLLGVLADAPYAVGQCELACGDVALLYTDGITEAWSATDPDDEFGEERLIAAAQEVEPEADRVLDAIQRAVASHTGAKPLDDDLTLLVLTRDQA